MGEKSKKFNMFITRVFLVKASIGRCNSPVLSTSFSYPQSTLCSS